MPRPNFRTYPPGTPLERIAKDYPNGIVRYTFRGDIEVSSLFTDRGQPQEMICPVYFPAEFHFLLDGQIHAPHEACKSCRNELACLVGGRQYQRGYTLNETIAEPLKKNERAARLGNQRSFK